MTRLVRAHRENRLERALQQLVYPKLLILKGESYRLKEKRRAGRSPELRLPKRRR